MNHNFCRDTKQFDVTKFRENLSESLHCFSTLTASVAYNNIALLFAEFVKIFKCVIMDKACSTQTSFSKTNNEN